MTLQSRIFIDGNEAIARASIVAGCTFFAGYPITPATSIYNHMLKLLPPEGGICLQGEDEISSIGFCLGASMAGRKVMTATSGPGISLMSEHISFAIGGEIPIVIVNVQRLGPSTGSATKSADGDIQFMRWGNSGGLPVIVLAPVTVLDCYFLTVTAFNLAERFRCPVFIASSREVAATKESVDPVGLELPAPVNRLACQSDGPHVPFRVSSEKLVPHFLPIGGERLVRQTSSTHGEEGYITRDHKVIGRSIARLTQKLEKGEDLAWFEHDEADNADILLVSYGITARSVREAVLLARRQGVRVSSLVLKSLYPVPETVIKNAAASIPRVVVVEMNTGQYVREIERLINPQKVQQYGMMDGELISPETVLEVICS